MKPLQRIYDDYLGVLAFVISDEVPMGRVRQGQEYWQRHRRLDRKSGQTRRDESVEKGHP